MKTLWRAHHSDLVLVHREATPIFFPFTEWFIVRILKKPMLYDFDDAIWMTDGSVSPLKGLLKYPSKTQKLCQLACRISTGNAFLAAYAQRYNSYVSVLPTVVDTQHRHNPKLYSTPKTDHVFTIGWTGTHSTLPYLDALWPVLKDLARDIKFRFLIIANTPPKQKYSWLYYCPWRKESEIKDLLNMDIGIMPLPNETWSQGKCGFKLIQYLALGIPALASPVGVNNTLINQGTNGYLCTTKQEWTTAIKRLHKDPELRKAMGAYGRQYIQRNYSAHNQHVSFLKWLQGVPQ